MTIDELAIAFKETRDEFLFNRIYNTFIERLRSFAHKYNSSRLTQQDIEHALSSTFELIWLKIDQFDPEKAMFTTWAHAILKNEILRTLKYRQQTFDLIDNVYEDTHAKDIEDKHIFENKYKEILSHFDKLSYEERLCIEEHFINGLKYKEIAKKHNLEIYQVKNRIHAALVAIRKEYKPKIKEEKPKRKLTEEHKQHLRDAAARNKLK